MKSFTSIVLFVIIYTFQGMTAHNFLHPQFITADSCPENHEKAEEKLNEELLNEYLLNNLRENYDIDIYSNMLHTISPLNEKDNQQECNKLMEILDKFGESGEMKPRSFYEIADHYFIVYYEIEGEGEFAYQSITMVNSEFEVIGVIFDW